MSWYMTVFTTEQASSNHLPSLAALEKTLGCQGGRDYGVRACALNRAGKPARFKAVTCYNVALLRLLVSLGGRRSGIGRLAIRMLAWFAQRFRLSVSVVLLSQTCGSLLKLDSNGFGIIVG